MKVAFCCQVVQSVIREKKEQVHYNRVIYTMIEICTKCNKLVAQRRKYLPLLGSTLLSTLLSDTWAWWRRMQLTRWPGGKDVSMQEENRMNRCLESLWVISYSCSRKTGYFCLVLSALHLLTTVEMLFDATIIYSKGGLWNLIWSPTTKVEMMTCHTKSTW